MAADLRPFPPSPRRLALARAAGMSAASPRVVGAAALTGALATIVVLGRVIAVRIGGWVTSACNAADGTAASTGAVPTIPTIPTVSTVPTVPGVPTVSTVPGVRTTTLALVDLAGTVLSLALPVLAATGLAALVAHIAQTRAFWIPRRRLPGAPSMPAHRGSWTAFDILCAATFGAVSVAWLWLTAPRLAVLVHEPSAAGLALVSFVVTLAITSVVLSVGDALLRRHQLATALAMTRDEKREDDRMTAADPRWQVQRLTIMRGAAGAAVARAAVVIVGDDMAIAIAWDPTRQPVPIRTATGRQANALALAALARRHRVAVHRDDDLARSLVDSEGPVPDAVWPRLAEIVAATRSRRA